MERMNKNGKVQEAPLNLSCLTGRQAKGET